MKRLILTLAIIYTCTLSLVCMETRWPAISDMEHLSQSEIIKTLARGIRKCACNPEFKFNNCQEIQDHVNKNHRIYTKYKCPTCPRNFKTLENALMHFAKEHTYESIYICLDCNIEFKNNRSFKGHQILHKKHKRAFEYLINRQAGKQNRNREFVCPECQSGPELLATSSQIRLLEHIERSHLLSSDIIENSHLSESPTSNQRPSSPRSWWLNESMLKPHQDSQTQTNNQEKEPSYNQFNECNYPHQYQLAPFNPPSNMQESALESLFGRPVRGDDNHIIISSDEDAEITLSDDEIESAARHYSKMHNIAVEPLHHMDIREPNDHIIISSESDENEEEEGIISSDEDIELSKEDTLAPFNPRSIAPNKLPSQVLQELLRQYSQPSNE